MVETKMTSTKNPWIQAAAGGAFTLIPARKHPAWLRHTLTWGSAAGMFALLAVPGAVPKLQQGLMRNKSGSGQEGAEKPDVEKIGRNPVARIGVAAGVGAATYGLFRFSFWLDGAAERGLHKLGVPYPRVVMGVGVAALHALTGEFDRRYDARGDQSPPSDAH